MTLSHRAQCENTRRGKARAGLQPLLLLSVVAVVLVQATLVAQQGASAGAAGSGEELFEQYQSIVERNIFSRFARSPRPEPRSEEVRAEAPPPAPRPGAGYVLTGVILGGLVPLALVEETAIGETRVFKVGAETPVGRLESVAPEGVTLVRGEDRRLIRVGYTLSGERSEKLAATFTTAPGVGGVSSPSAGASSTQAERPRERSPVASGTGSPASRRADIWRRMRERRQRELGE